jgi:RimJ/RimL family protein N-acetyltransferase
MTAPAFPDPPLAAEGIVLRRVEDGDISWITEACNDPDITRFIEGMPSPYMEADARSFLERVRSGWEAGSRAAFVIADDAARGLGVITLHFDANDSTLSEVGYWLRPEGRGRGAATAAVRLVAGWAFEVMSIQRLQLTTAPGNIASQRVADRTGFTFEGRLRGWRPVADGRRRDSLMFSLLPSDRTGAS